MNKLVQTLSLTVLAMSLGTLAACSKSDDTPAPPPASTSPAPSGPSGPAAPAEPPAPAAPGPATPQQQSAPADQQSMGDKLQDAAAAAREKAVVAGNVIADKAGEMAHKAGDAANSARESVVDSATRADAAIQNAVGDKKE